MLRPPEFDESLLELLAGPPVTAAERLEVERLLRPLLWMQQYPDIAIMDTAGVALPPHQRIMIYLAHLGASWNVNVSSRGTSKSSAWCVLYQGYKTLVFAKRKSVVLSATGFRGGQLIMNDYQRLVEGGWDGQEADLSFWKRSIESPNIVHRAQNFWQVKLSSFSNTTTFPTNDEDKLRGIRGNDLFLDEANTMSRTLIKTVAEPFLTVTGGFREGSDNAHPNSIYYTTTLDYAWRPFMDTVQAAQTAIQRDWDAYHAAQRKDWKTYERLEIEGLCDYTYVSFDYTDTLVRRYIRTRDGRKMEVLWSDKTKWRKRPRGIPFTTRDEKGKIQRDGRPVEVIQTYPLDLKIVEGGLFDGSTPESVWLAEQRNLVDTAIGDVYPHHVIDAATCAGERCVIPYAKCGEPWKKAYAGDTRDYLPGVMYSCTDPCVVGVDFAGGDRDFATFVVYRVGPLAKGAFNPMTGLGNTAWSNVIWAEQHRLMSAPEVAEKIRELSLRYNLAFYDEPWQQDDWKRCRAIGLDLRGGGTAVRDELVYISVEGELGDEKTRIYDPLDKDPRIAAFAKDRRALPMLDGIAAQDSTNDALVNFTLAQMQQGKLFIAKWLPESLRDTDRRLDIGYAGIKVLEHQLRKIQQEPTRNYRRFFMAGDNEKTENKKDLFSGFLYGSKQLRAHLIRVKMINERPPVTAAARVTIGAGKRGGSNGALPGSGQVSRGSSTFRRRS